MEIRIKETGKIEHLELIDPKSGVCWVRDLMGNHDATPPMEQDTEGYETGRYMMAQYDFNWWSNLCRAYQESSDREEDIRWSLNPEKREEFEQELSAINCDLEDIPAIVNEICDRFDE